LERGQKKLAGAKEIAQGTVYTESIPTTWRPPRFIREISEVDHDMIRMENHIITEGRDIPPPITNFTVRQLQSVQYTQLTFRT
jgi:ATP-dependent RNA helicase DDX41